MSLLPQALKSEVDEKAVIMKQVTEDGSAILSAGGTGNVQELGKTLVRLGDSWDKVKAGVEMWYTRFHQATDNWAACKGRVLFLSMTDLFNIRG
jgi:hypothetical protein